jgi:hypothetical protein
LSVIPSLQPTMPFRNLEMKATFDQIRNVAASAFIVILVSGCSLMTRRVPAGEEITLKVDESVSVAGTSLNIKLKGVGHQWYVDKRAESPYAELEISGGGSPNRKLTLGESAEAGEYNIKLVAANPFHDKGGPDCKLIVTRR